MEKEKDLESKQEDETSTQEAPTEDKNEDTSTQEDLSKNEEESDESSSQEDDSIDYKVELEKETKARERAEHKIVQLKTQKKEAEEEVSEEVSEESPSDVQKQIDEGVEKARVDMVEDEVESALQDITSNEDERELIRFHYENTIKKSGYSRLKIKQDLDNARLIANKKSILSANVELSKALQSKNSMGSAGMGNNQAEKDTPDSDFDKLSESDKTFLLRRGVDPKTYKLKSDPNVVKSE